VIALYEAYSEGRDADAHALFAKIKAPGWGYAEPASWRRDLRIEKVGKAVPVRIPGGNAYYERLFDVREASVAYYQAHDVGSRERGDMMEWVIVARETPDGPWRIIDVGTGP
jgi:hypothetical protein